ncbi:MAG TPA: hypothetical protein VD766_12260 [Solirubrobacterales bacterium]|nr:hypothetical protein [Solirubrobacterales bacterium]
MGVNRDQEEQGAALEQLADAVQSELGFTMVVVNLFRPETDDYLVVVVRGPGELQEAIGGQTISRESWMALFDGRFERFGAFFIPEGEGDWGDAAVYEPEEDSGEGENRWRKGDALFAPIRCSAGAILGIISLDVPNHGQRPTDRQLLKLSAIAAQAGQALEPQ